MKLLNYTTTYFAGILIILLAIWAVIFYFEIMDEIYDSLDDGLDNQKLLVIRKARTDPGILQRSNFEDGYYVITPTTAEIGRGFTDDFRDTLMYMENESEYEPVRLLESVFQHEGNFYKIKVITSMIEEDDLQKELFFSILYLYLALIFIILLLNIFLQKKAWRPFYKLLGRLEKFSIEKNNEIKFESTNIDEFRLLNDRVDRLIKKSVESYTSQKEFIENAAHELQTPLAISINKLELMAENSNLTHQQMDELGVVLNSLEKLTLLNKSLLLLSRIENRQFAEENSFPWNDKLKKIIYEFRDFTSHRNMKINLIEDGVFDNAGNKDLVGILLSNLLRNAIIHSAPGTEINISISSRAVSFENSGTEPLDEEKIFKRFHGTENARSTGLGLAISKAITDKFNMKLTYQYSSEKHIFIIEAPGSNS